MTGLFLDILGMSLSASVLVLAVVLLRFALKKAPKWITCCLWILVAVRLVCPFSIESVFSLIPQSVSSSKLLTNAADTYVEDHIIFNDTTDEYQTAVDAGREPVYIGNGHYYVVTGADGISEPATVETTVIPILCSIWLVGTAVMVLYAVCSYLRLRRKVAPSINLRDNIYLCDYIDSPFILGIVKPKIYLPSSMEQSRWPHVLAHEKAHLRRRDHWWKPLGYILLCIHWFNPLMWLAYILLCRDIELACDEKVIKDLGALEKKSYSEALLSCSVPRHMIAACPLAFGEVGVKERVKTVLNYKKPAFWIILVAIIACVITAVCFLTDPVTEPEADPGEFYATVLEVHTGEILVAPEDGSREAQTSDQIMVMLPEESPAIQVGDTVRIVYDGLIQALYPASIPGTTTVEIVLPAQFPSADVPSLNMAVLDGCVAMVDGDVVANQNVWQDFVNKTNSGKSATVRFVTYHTIGDPAKMSEELFESSRENYPVMNVHVLSFDGSVYTLRWAEGETEYTQTWRYLMHYTGKPSSQYAEFESYDCYMLTDRNDVTYEELWNGMFSADFRDQIPFHQVYNDYIYADEPTFRQLESAKKALEPYMVEYRIATLDANELTGRLDVEVYEWVDGLYNLLGRYINTHFVTVTEVKGTIAFTGIPDDWDLSMTGQLLDGDGLEITIQLTGNATITYGSEWFLEESIDGQWQAVPTLESKDGTEFVWTDELLYLTQDKPTVICIYWEYLYGELSPGLYRIGKEFINESTGEVIPIYAEFAITD